MFFVIKEASCVPCEYSIIGSAKSKPLAKKLIPKPTLGERYRITKVIATLDAVQDVALVELESEPEKAEEKAEE